MPDLTQNSPATSNALYDPTCLEAWSAWAFKARSRAARRERLSASRPRGHAAIATLPLNSRRKE